MGSPVKPSKLPTSFKVPPCPQSRWILGQLPVWEQGAWCPPHFAAGNFYFSRIHGAVSDSSRPKARRPRRESRWREERSWHAVYIWSCLNFVDVWYWLFSLCAVFIGHLPSTPISIAKSLSPEFLEMTKWKLQNHICSIGSIHTSFPPTKSERMGHPHAVLSLHSEVRAVVNHCLLSFRFLGISDTRPLCPQTPGYTGKTHQVVSLKPLFLGLMEGEKPLASSFPLWKESIHSILTALPKALFYFY